MPVPATCEAHLIAEYDRTRAAYHTEPWRLGLRMAFDLAREDLAAFIREDAGRPAEDWQACVRYELDEAEVIRAVPFGPLLSWQARGAWSIPYRSRTTEAQGWDSRSLSTRPR